MGISLQILGEGATSLPASIGRFRSVVTEREQKGAKIVTYNDLVSCSGLFSQVNESITEVNQEFIEGGLCLDPEVAVVNGASIY